MHTETWNVVFVCFPLDLVLCLLCLLCLSLFSTLSACGRKTIVHPPELVAETINNLTLRFRVTECATLGTNRKTHGWRKIWMISGFMILRATRDRTGKG